LSNKIVVVGGGNGNFNVLRGLKKYDTNLTAIVAMSDSGGSSGRLRDQLKQLPYGDVRQCLIALADEDIENGLLKDIFTHRFSEEGDLSGHSMGNLMLAALTEFTGGPERAIESASRLLKVKGQVLPVTLTRTDLHAVLSDGTLLEKESIIDTYGGSPGVAVDYVYLEPSAYPYPPSIEAINKADMIVFSPGDLYTSLVPNLLVKGVSEAIVNSSAQVVSVISLMTKPGETTGFTASNYVEEINKYLGQKGRIDVLLANSDQIPPNVLKRYSREGSELITLDKEITAGLLKKIVETPLADEGPHIRHDPDKLAQALINLFH
jgi:uncharacterized cofD-like protein